MNYNYCGYIIYLNMYDQKWHITDPSGWLNTDALAFNTWVDAEDWLEYHCF